MNLPSAMAAMAAMDDGGKRCPSPMNRRSAANETRPREVEHREDEAAVLPNESSKRKRKKADVLPPDDGQEVALNTWLTNGRRLGLHWSNLSQADFERISGLKKGDTLYEDWATEDTDDTDSSDQESQVGLPLQPLPARAKAEAKAKTKARHKVKAKKPKKPRKPKKAKPKKAKAKKVELSPGELKYMFKKTFETGDFNFLISTFAIYRECLRRQKKKNANCGLPEPENVMQQFQDAIKNLEEGAKMRLLQMLNLKFRPKERRDQVSFCELMRGGHFTNVFHYHDTHNKILRNVSPYISAADFLVITVLCYFTGDREFVHKVVQHCNSLVENGTYTADDIAKRPEGFARARVKAHIKCMSYTERRFVSLFHRRFRPAMLWDNHWRSILLDGVSDESKRDEVPRSLLEFCMARLREFYLPIAKCASNIAAQKEYSEIFLAIEKASKKTDAVTFHAKNMANTLESRYLDCKWHAAPESEHNGLGPGFRYMSHIKAGHGKCTGKLTRDEMEECLNDTTQHLQNLWPFGSQVRKRHVQSLYCETQKFLKMARQGSAFATICRVQKGITWESLHQAHEQRERRKKSQVSKAKRKPRKPRKQPKRRGCVAGPKGRGQK